MKNAAWENWINLVLGVWVMLSPWVLPLPPEDARLSLVISNSLAGAVIFGGSALAIQELTVGEEVACLAMGIWLVLSPWVLGFSDDPASLWNALAVGLAVTGTSFLGLSVARTQRRDVGR